MPHALLEEIRNWFWPAGMNDAAPAPAGPNGDAEAGAAKPCAFVVDDQGSISNLISMILEAAGVRSQVFHTAEDAVAALEAGHPQIVFLDFALRKSDAVDVIRGLAGRRYRGPVQVMSASDPEVLEDLRRIGTRHGLDMWPAITKPFRAEVIYQVIAGVVLEHERGGRGCLDEALANGWLDLWYQPKVDLRARKLAGAEGLIRCHHPVRGLIEADTLLRGASESSMATLTEFVVVRALRDFDDIAASGADVHIAVNTNLDALTRISIQELVREYRPRTRTWPGLIIEASEGDVVRDVALVHDIATQLSAYGITFSIDDFGTGYSSFARLREVPFVELKLDGSFVQGCATDAGNAGICRAIIDLAHHFGAVAVAEGIETAADLQAIHRMGCDMGQGFLLARPMSKLRFIASLRPRTMRAVASQIAREYRVATG